MALFLRILCSLTTTTTFFILQSTVDYCYFSRSILLLASVLLTPVLLCNFEHRLSVDSGFFCSSPDSPSQISVFCFCLSGLVSNCRTIDSLISLASIFFAIAYPRLFLICYSVRLKPIPSLFVDSACYISSEGGFATKPIPSTNRIDLDPSGEAWSFLSD